MYKIPLPIRSSHTSSTSLLKCDLLTCKNIRSDMAWLLTALSWQPSNLPLIHLIHSLCCYDLFVVGSFQVLTISVISLSISLLTVYSHSVQPALVLLIVRQSVNRGITKQRNAMTKRWSQVME